MSPSIDAVTELRRLEAELGELRARLLPARPPALDPWQGATQGFAFRTEVERFALPLDQVVEVLPMCLLTPYPEAPPWFPGLLNLHGRLVPVLDLSARLRRHGRETDPAEFIVIARHGATPVGLLVAQALGTEPVDAGHLQRVPPELPQAPYVAGLFEARGVSTFALHLQALMTASELPDPSP